jgi:hypothetical protein
MLLVSVSVTIAQTESPLRLAATLKRDLGALRAQLEQIDPSPGEGERRTVAFNADVGDGGPVFRHLSMMTVVRAAGRHLEWLIAACEGTRDDDCRRSADTLRPDMLELTEQLDRLGRAASPDAVVALRDEVSAVLDRLDGGLARLAMARSTSLPPRAAKSPTSGAAPS